MAIGLLLSQVTPGGRYEFSLLLVTVKQSPRISFGRFRRYTRPSAQAVAVFAYFVGTRPYRCFQPPLSLSLSLSLSISHTR